MGCESVDQGEAGQRVVSQVWSLVQRETYFGRCKALVFRMG